MPKIPDSAKSSNTPLEAPRIASNAVPVKKTLKGTPKPKCIACGGTGRNSRGGLCSPCNGKGTPYTWVCPVCNARHDGFGNTMCRNEKCPSKRLRSK